MMDEPISSSEKSKKINVISKQTIHQICSGQVRLTYEYTNIQPLYINVIYSICNINYFLANKYMFYYS